MAKVAFITVITGQDGVCLTELLLKKGYDVHGLKRRFSPFNTDRIGHLLADEQGNKQVMDDAKFREVFPGFQFADFQDGIAETVKYYKSVYPY